jgi:enolase
MIKNLKAYPAFDSLGGKAVTIRAFTDRGSYSASVPVKSLEPPLSIFSSIRPNFIGLDEGDLKTLDAFLQELTREKPLTLAMSLALARAGTDNSPWSLGTGRVFPLPLAGILSNKDHMLFIIPYRAKTPEEASETCLEVYASALEGLRNSKSLKGISPSGSWFCSLDMLKSLEFMSSLAGDWDLRIGIDLSQGLWDGRKYTAGPRALSPSSYLDFLEEISRTYRIYYLEDPFHKQDTESPSILGARRGRIKKGIIAVSHQQAQEGQGRGLESGRGMVVSPVQAGTISETARLSGLAGGLSILSQAPRETGDSYLADLSILCKSCLMKTGLSGSGMTRLNRLIELWGEIPNAGISRLP